MQQALRGLGRAMPGAKSWLLMLGVGTPDLARSRPSPGGGDCWTGCPMRGGRAGYLLGRSGNPVSHKGDAGGGGRGGARHGTQGTLGRW